ITRLPIIEGEISHIEIPRGQASLGLTIVGGADTPLRCVVVQEVFPDGLVAQDGRLQAGDQIIEVDGKDMTSASHQQVCEALRRHGPVLSLGVYRERIEAYRTTSPTTPHPHLDIHQGDVVMVTLIKERSRPLGLKLGGRRSQPGIFVMEVLEGSVAWQDGRLHPHDHILAINGADVRYARLHHASNLIHQSHDHVTLIVNREAPLLPPAVTPSPKSPRCLDDHPWRGSSTTSESEFPVTADERGNLQYVRSASCDSLSDHSLMSSMMSSPGPRPYSEVGGAASPSTPSPGYYTDDTDDTDPNLHPDAPHYTTGTTTTTTTNGSHHNHHHSITNVPTTNTPAQHTPPVTCSSLPVTPRGARLPEDSQSLVSGLKQLLQAENTNLQQKNITVKKSMKESLGMRIGGGVNSNEGDTPIYIANINPQGPIGRCRNIKKGDVVLSVNGQSLLGLTHGQAVALLKATAELGGVTLVLLEGPESEGGAGNFVPSWLYWQKLPRCLHLAKSVVLHRAAGASLGFSIVGGADPQRGPEPIHVLFVVQSSPAALDGKLRCGDRLLAVDGRSLELVRHAAAVALLKQAGQRVHLQVVSWLGTEL
ncbi:hypothetical protein Pcinc_040121, partial [Petrolisthes cinctipes]